MPFADLILKNARVVTMDATVPAAEMVAVKGDRILFVGNSESLELVRGLTTRVIDCAGKTIVPGFNDAHCHIFSFLRQLLSIDISPSSVSSIEDIKAAVHQKAQLTPRGQWLTGSGYNDFYLAEKRHPTRWDIDEVSPHHPVVLLHRSLHACVLNSRALALAGISAETEEPPGVTIERDLGSGEPTGLLFEMVGHISKKLLPPLSQEELSEGITLVNRRCLSQGITSLQDATVNNDFERWQQFRRFKDASLLKSRLSMMCGIEAVNRFLEAGLTGGSGDTKLRLGGVKVVLTDAPGKLYPPQPELNRQVLAAHQAGFQVAIHAVQQETVEGAITALEYAQSLQTEPSGRGQLVLSTSHEQGRRKVEGLPQAGRRHRIEHCSECPPHLLERLKKLGVVIVTQPPFLYYSGERYLATVTAERLPWLYRIKSFLDSGLVVAGSSDSPIAPDNPLVGIYAAVTRNAETGQSVLLEERISASRALEMYTINAAYASFEENIKGSITRGKLADMVILSDDPTRLPESSPARRPSIGRTLAGERDGEQARSPLERIKEIKVEMTILDGEVVWEV